MVLETALSPNAVGPWVRSQIAQLDPIVPVEIQPLTDRVNRMAGRPRFETALLSFFAFTGLVMAVIGLYGVVSFMTAQRTQEIGVRMALGAGRLAILRLIAWEGLRLIVPGGAAGLIAALGMSVTLRSLLFSVSPHDPATFLCVALVLVAVAFTATMIPARAATKIDPIQALRAE